MSFSIETICERYLCHKTVCSAYLTLGLARRNGISPIVLQLHDDIVEWQRDSDCMRLPSMEEQRSLCQRIENYLGKDKKAIVDSMRQAFPSDVDSVQALQLDCLQLSDDMEGGVKWRSETERSLMHSIAGWHEGYVPQPLFVPLLDMLSVDEESSSPSLLQEVFLVLENVNMSLPIKLQRVAAMLDCTPTISGIGEALARRVLHHSTDDVDEPLDRYVCRLCLFSADNQKDFHEHLVEKHRGAGDESRAVIEYRKKVIGLIEHMGPDVSWFCLAGTFGQEFV